MGQYFKTIFVLLGVKKNQKKLCYLEPLFHDWSIVLIDLLCYSRVKKVITFCNFSRHPVKQKLLQSTVPNRKLLLPTGIKFPPIPDPWRESNFFHESDAPRHFSTFLSSVLQNFSVSVPLLLFPWVNRLRHWFTSVEGIMG